MKKNFSRIINNIKLIEFWQLMIEIDGSKGEGGGSILRQSLALSLLTKKPFRIINIRAGRPNPGLNYQHLSSIELAKNISHSKVIGAQIGSKTIEFYPGEIRGGEINLDIGSAGSIVLSLQSIIIPAIFSGHKFKFNLIGGTDVSWSPTIDYFKEIFAPSIENYCKMEIVIHKRGFYPSGGGSVTLTLAGNKTKESFIRAFLGDLISIKGIITSSKTFFVNSSLSKVGELAGMSIKFANVNSNISVFSTDSNSIGASFTLYAVFQNPLQKERYLRVGVCEIADNEQKLIENIEKKSLELRKLIVNRIPVDNNLADQLIVLLGFLGGKIVTDNLSSHTLSNIAITEIFLEKKFSIKKLEGDKVEISCD
jgi:RNA 3'-phosphate cyclase